jgi:rhodanese-related sulfurtransferase
MPQNMMSKTAGPKTATNGKTMECMSAVEFFSAKLSYQLSPMALKGMMDMNALKDICLIDVRSIEAYKQCRITMALCIPMAELEGKMNTLPKDKMIVAYCSDMTCGLAPKACLELAKKGFKVMELMGGLEAWMEKGLPVDKLA